MSNLDTNHYLISFILFLLIVIVFMSTKQSLCNIKENFGQNTISSEPLEIENGYDSNTDNQAEFINNSVVETSEVSDVVSNSINEFNIAAQENNKLANNTEVSDYSEKVYKSSNDYSQSDGAVYSLVEKENVNPNINTDENLMGIRQSNEDVYGEPEVLEPKEIKDDYDGKIIEDPNLGKPNKCDHDTSKDSTPGPFDPFNRYSYSEFDLNFSKTKAYRPKKLGESLDEYTENEENMSHDQNVYNKQKCKIIKNALKEIDNKHYTKTAKEPWNDTFKKPCGKWNE